MKYVIMDCEDPIAVAHSENDAQEFILSLVEEAAYWRFCENPNSDIWPLWYYDSYWYHPVPEISPFPQNSFFVPYNRENTK